MEQSFIEYSLGKDASSAVLLGLSGSQAKR